MNNKISPYSCFVMLARCAMGVGYQIFFTIVCFGLISYVILLDGNNGVTENRWKIASSQSGLIRQLCASRPPKLKGKLNNISDLSNSSWDDIANLNRKVDLGGKYTPSTCKPRHKVAIIIPLRGRESHLKTLLGHIHPILQRQEIAYKVFVVIQEDGELFNRAKLLNVGVSEAKKGKM